MEDKEPRRGGGRGGGHGGGAWCMVSEEKGEAAGVPRTIERQTEAAGTRLNENQEQGRRWWR